MLEGGETRPTARFPGPFEGSPPRADSAEPSSRPAGHGLQQLWPLHQKQWHKQPEVCPTSGPATQSRDLGRAIRTQLQPTVLEPQQSHLSHPAACRPEGKSHSPKTGNPCWIKIHFAGSEKGLFSSSSVFSGLPSLFGVEHHHSFINPPLTLSQNPLGRRQADPTPRERPTDVEDKENKVEKWEDISGLLSLSLSFLRLFEVSFSSSLL